VQFVGVSVRYNDRLLWSEVTGAEAKVPKYPGRYEVCRGQLAPVRIWHPSYGHQISEGEAWSSGL
jgi:hypothetical protein